MSNSGKGAEQTGYGAYHSGDETYPAESQRYYSHRLGRVVGLFPTDFVADGESLICLIGLNDGYDAENHAYA